MKSYRTNRGPFATRPFYKTADIEAICTDELLDVQLFPKAPEPIRIERFIEKRFGITHDTKTCQKERSVIPFLGRAA